MKDNKQLPLHLIDTGVLFEANRDSKLGNQCSDYLNRVGYKYRGIVPLSVLGEFFLIVFRDVQNYEEKHLLFNFMDRLIKRRKIYFSALKHDSFVYVDQIKEIDFGIEDTDAVHIANCIQDKGNTFVTLDSKILEDKQLEIKFGIKMMHPKDL